MKNLILVAGDGDFTDMVKFMKETFNVRVFMFAWSASVNYQISTIASDIIYLDEIFESVSEANRGSQLTNAEKLRTIEILKGRESVIEAATHKWPEPHEYNKCLEFAIKLL